MKEKNELKPSQNITEDKIKFLLDFLSILLKTYGEPNPEVAQYFEKMLTLAIEKPRVNYKVLNAFFAKRPKTIPTFLSKENSLYCDHIIHFIEKFINFPDLITQTIEKDIDPELIGSMTDTSTLYSRIVERHVAKHGTISAERLDRFLELMKYLRENIISNVFTMQFNLSLNPMEEPMIIKKPSTSALVTFKH